MPEHATIEDAIERLCFIVKIEEGLRQSDAGQLVSHDEVKKQFFIERVVATALRSGYPRGFLRPTDLSNKTLHPSAARTGSSRG